MKKILIICVFCIFSCSSDSQNKICSDSFTINEKISNLFNLEVNHILLSDYQETIFFCSLPNNFNEYILYYSKSWKFKNQKIWLSEGYHLQKYLPRLKKISKYKVLNKLFELGKGGRWDAEVHVLQDIIQSEYAVFITTAIELLNNKPEKEILSFWHFFYDGPHPENCQKDYEELYKRYHKENPRIAKLMKQSYEKLLENGCQGH